MSSKTREALNQLLGLIDNGVLVFSNELDTSEVCNAQYQIDKADEALAEPLRNCDIGTVVEQKERFDKYCASRKCYECPVYFQNQKSADCYCGLWWAQMPYDDSQNIK